VGDYPADAWTFAGNFNYNTANGTVHDIISTATLTIKASNQSKCAGETFTFAGTEFTVTGLLDGDQVTSVTLTSAGAGSSATTGGYDIVASAAIGSGLGNYTIQYQNGTLTVNSTPVITTSNTCIGGNGATFTQTGGTAGGTWQVSGGGSIDQDGNFTPTTA